MNSFQLFAQPWWVNAAFAVPFVAYFYWRKKRIHISKPVLILSGIFAAAFGFVEAAAVVYLRSATGLLSGFIQSNTSFQLPAGLATIEFLRELATIIMLVCVSLLSAKSWKERSAVFLWTFAIWDIVYYAGLWLAIGWPTSLLSLDVLFLIPVPWFSQVWFPVLVSTLTAIFVVFANRGEN